MNMNELSIMALFFNRGKSPKSSWEWKKMEWNEFLKEIEENPFLLMGLLMIALGVLSWNKVLVWMGGFLVIMIVLLTRGFNNEKRAG
ncbi:hypothetical protein E3E31_07400 [Thermococcus sp. M39]|uniref:hypothetical protein n=1 Tax=Thermococcus sp. M39 TaxID=1638262 RepID=UPI00143BEE05|nr:hypothetical protein [Thermococcus sp. M39]NJE08349.1 hypothetical protein [Thermococcus sp. M39]